MAVVPSAAENLSNKFFQKHDPARTLRDYRNFIPKIVLEKFCSGNEQSTLVFVDQYQVQQVYTEKILTLYMVKNGEFVRNHVEQSFGKENIYSSFFDNFTTDSYCNAGFDKLLSLKKVDGRIYNNISNALWGIVGPHQQGHPIPSISRGEYGELRKALYLMTALGNREKNMHTFAHRPLMENARNQRHQFKEDNHLEHVRDVWLSSVEQMLDLAHADIPGHPTIFEYDSLDYFCNARNRFLVFWEAPPGEEFLLTDTAFGGFEGSQIGEQEGSNVDVDIEDMQKHIYTKDFMWHQLYVLSPTLCVALCHPTLMHPEMTKIQIKNWGLRPSLLEKLPHGRPRNYYKDVTINDGVFPAHFNTEELPAEVKKEFGKKSNGDRHKDDELHFNVQRISPKQVTLVNSILLQNQQDSVPVNNVCIRPTQVSQVESTYRCLYNSLKKNMKTKWSKYSREPQNNYEPLLLVLQAQLIRPPQDYVESVQSSTSVYSPVQGQQYAMSYAVGAGDVPPVFEHMDVGRQPQIRAHSASTQSSLTSSFTPSSQSSYYSSTSSQSSASTKTTSHDTPRYEPQEFRASSPPRKEHKQKKIQGPTPRGSDASGKTQRSKKSDNSEWTQQSSVHNPSIVIDQSMDGPGSQSSGGVPIFRGRNPDPVHFDPPSNHSSKRGSPNPPYAEVDINHQQRYHEPVIQQMAPPTRANGDRSNHSEHRPRLHDRARTEPQVISSSHARGPTTYGVGLDNYIFDEQHQAPRRSNRSPERPVFQDALPQPPRRRSPERPQLNRNTASAPVTDHRYEPTQHQRSNHSDSRSRPVRVESDSHGQPKRQSSVRRDESVRSDRSHRASRNGPSPQVRNSQIIDKIGDRLHQVFNDEISNTDLPPPPLQPRSINRSPERQPEPVRHVAPQKAYNSDTNGRVYHVAQSQNRRHAEKSYHSDSQSNPYRVPQQPTQRPPSREVPATQTMSQQQPKQHVKQASQSTLNPHPLPPVPQSQPMSRHSSNTSDRPGIRPGVEIVAARPAATALPPPPVIVEKVVSAPPSEPEPPKTPARAENPRFKQLRFETPPHPKLNHKSSDISIAGSMVAEFGDSPQSTQLQRIQIDSDASEDDTDGSGSVDEDSEITSCEDNAADPYVETKPVKRNVRFADSHQSPVRASHPERTRKAQETQAPTFDLPIPPSTRYPGFNSTKTKQPAPPVRRQ